MWKDDNFEKEKKREKEERQRDILERNFRQTSALSFDNTRNSSLTSIGLVSIEAGHEPSRNKPVLSCLNYEI